MEEDEDYEPEGYARHPVRHRKTTVILCTKLVPNATNWLAPLARRWKDILIGLVRRNPADSFYDVLTVLYVFVSVTMSTTSGTATSKGLQYPGTAPW